MSPAMLSNYASIMVSMDLGAQAEQRAKVAVALADRFSSRIIGIASRPILAPLYFEMPVTGVSSIVEIEERRAFEDLSKAEKLFRSVAGTRAKVEWRQAQTVALECILEHVRAADLIVTSRARVRDLAYDPMTVDCADLIMNAGRPVLVVPPDMDYLSAKRVVVGWKDTREARRAVYDALPMLEKNADEVFVVAIGAGEQGAKDAVEFLDCHQVSASLVFLGKVSNAPADELVRIANQEAADLIVCGAYGHSRVRE